MKCYIRWKSEAVPQERTFLDNYIVNVMDRNKIVIIIVGRILGAVEISVA
jgi:hypothetical protein